MTLSTAVYLAHLKESLNAKIAIMKWSEKKAYLFYCENNLGNCVNEFFMLCYKGYGLKRSFNFGFFKGSEVLQNKQKTSKKIAFDIIVLNLRIVLLCLEILSKFTCNFTTNNKYGLQVTRNILKLLILPATVLYLFNSIDSLLKNGKDPKQDIKKIEIIAKKLAIIGLSLFILISVNYRTKFFFEEVFIRNKKANKDDYYIPLLDPTVVHYLFLTAAILFLISSIIKCYSAYNKAYGSSNSTYEDKRSFYKSVCFLLLDLAIFLTETLGYEIVPSQEVSVAPNVTYDFNLSDVLMEVRDFFYVQSSFYGLMQPGSSLDNTETTKVDGSNLSP